MSAKISRNIKKKLYDILEKYLFEGITEELTEGLQKRIELMLIEVGVKPIHVFFESTLNTFDGEIKYYVNKEMKYYVMSVSVARG